MLRRADGQTDERAKGSKAIIFSVGKNLGNYAVLIQGQMKDIVFV